MRDDPEPELRAGPEPFRAQGRVNDAGLEGTRRAENTLEQLWPRLPDTVTVHPEVDLQADDPAYVDEPINAGHGRQSRRRCIASKQNGDRCGGRAMLQHLLCPLHGERLSPQQGAQALHAQRREAKRRADAALSLQKLGTRAVVAEALVAEAANVEKAVKLLCRSAGGGDLAAAKALIPWINQAFGMPTERVEQRPPSTLEELEQMDTAELARLVARGRERRLRALEVVPGTPGAEG